MKKNNSIRGYKLRTLAIVALCVILVLAALSGCGGTEGTSDETGSSSSIKTNDPRETEKVICNDDNMKATFIKMYDPNAGVTMYSVVIKIENNDDQQITVNLTDAYVNDTAVTFMTSLPVTIASGKNAVGSFLFGYNNLGFDSIEDVTKLEFKICSYADDMSVIRKTDTITLEF